MSKDKVILMPEALTAENGAKYLLSGEFHEWVSSECPNCDEGYDPDGGECLECGGGGSIDHKVAVSWTTIKGIYAMAVKYLGKPAPPEQMRAEV